MRQIKHLLGKIECPLTELPTIFKIANSNIPGTQIAQGRYLKPGIAGPLRERHRDGPHALASVVLSRGQQYGTLAAAGHAMLGRSARRLGEIAVNFVEFGGVLEIAGKPLGKCLQIAAVGDAGNVAVLLEDAERPSACRTRLFPLIGLPRPHRTVIVPLRLCR